MNALTHKRGGKALADIQLGVNSCYIIINTYIMVPP